jgi:type I restriction enzyme S subunit
MSEGQFLSETKRRRFRPYPKYKDSGVEWLGKIPVHWNAFTLKRICRLAYGDALQSEERRTGDVEVFGSNGAIGTHDRANTRGPCLVVGRKGSFGKINYSSNPVFAIDTTFFVDRHLTDADLRWLFYILTWLRLDTISKDSAIPGLDREDTYACPVPSCNQKEQQAIASFLDRETAKIDALIEKKERLTELLQEKRTALITQAITKGLNPTVPMKDSGVEWLGKIPTHWEVKRLKQVGMAIIGLTYDPTDVVGPEEGVIVLRASNVCDGHIILEDNVFVNRTIPERLSTKVDDILICSRSGSRALIGKSAKIDKSLIGLTFGAFMTVFRSVCNDYLFYAFNSTIFNYQSGAFLTSTINQLTISNLNNFTVPVPPHDEQSAIATFLDCETARIDALVAQIHEAIDRLKEYRTALISAAVTGKIDVRAEVAQ